MHGVVRTELVCLGEVAGPLHERLIDIDEVQLFEELLKLCGEPASLRRRHPAGSLRLGKRGTCLDVGEANGDESIGREPLGSGSLRADLLDEQRHNGRGVEVRDQRRCSATRSDTLPFVLIGAGSRRFAVLAGVTRPSRIIRSIVRSPLMGSSRATARPRSVTTTSSPACTRSRYWLRWSRSSRMPTSAMTPLYRSRMTPLGRPLYVCSRRNDAPNVCSP